MPSISCRTLVELLRHRAREQPEQTAHIFLTDGESQESRLTYAELDWRARAVGALLQAHPVADAPVLLLYPPGLDFITAFFGAAYGGAIAVPTYPPHPVRPEKNLPRIRAISRDSMPKAVIATSAICALEGEISDRIPELGGIPWLATEGLSEDMAAGWRDPGTDGESLALLQYTSGSTAAPKGVMVTHGNLLHNSEVIRIGFEHDADSVGVIWLPPYHDMGLIGGILQPVYAGFPVVLMSPVAFLEKPSRWLTAVSRYGGTTSGGPNFAYRLCARKIRPGDTEGLDLDSWSVAFNGAEPVHHKTLEEFASAFAHCGFRREAFYPCYGLAEATLMVSGGRKSALPVVQKYDGDALKRHGAVRVTDTESRAQTGGETLTLVGCGRSFPNHTIAIVDPDTCEPCTEGRVGEIWVSGPSVAKGFWGREEESGRDFGVRPAGTHDGSYMRTGDLGFLYGGELFVTGRIKDVIIIRGLNHYPQDIERTVEACHPALRSDSSAAFQVEVGQEERLIVLCEVERSSRNADLDQVIESIRQAIGREHEIDAHSVALIRAGNLPKTPSGKIQRGLCRARYLQGDLEIAADWIQRAADPVSRLQAAPAAPSDLARRLREVGPVQGEDLLIGHIRAQATGLLGLDPSYELDLDRPLSELGLSSMMAVEIATDLAEAVGRELPESLLLDHQTIRELARHLALQVQSEAVDEPRAR